MASAQWDKEDFINVNSLDPLYKFDTHFPDRLGRYKVEAKSPSPRANKRGRDRNLARFKTQPITFDEIKEVDEDSVEDSKEGLRHQFAAFSRSMDGLVPGYVPGAMPHPAARDVKPSTTVPSPIADEIKSRDVQSSSLTSPVDTPDGNVTTESAVDMTTDALARIAENSAMDYGHIHPRRKKKHAKSARRLKKENDDEIGDTPNNGDPNS